jgi:hypothetical protein
MKKFLLLQLFALVGFVTANAHNLGDYVYTSTAKYKVVSTNLITNSQFTSTDGWSQVDGSSVSPDVWSVEQAAGPNGENALMSYGSADAATAIFTSVPYEVGKTYIVSFDIIAGDEGAQATSATSTESNYVNVFSNSDGTIDGTTNYQSVGESFTTPLEWTNVSFAIGDTISAGSTGKIFVAFGRLSSGTMITNVEVVEVQQVFDTRVAQRVLGYYQSVVETGYFPNDPGMFVDEPLATISGILAAAEAGDADAQMMIDNVTEMEGLMKELADGFTVYLDANSATMEKVITNYDIQKWTKFNNGDNKTNMGDWYFYGTANRWGHATDAVEANYSYPGSYDLGPGYIYIQKAQTALGYAGKYFFACDLRAQRYFEKKIDGGYYGIDYSFYSDGSKLFFGNDSITLPTLDNRTLTRHFIVGELAENDTLRVGAWFPGFDDKGGTFRIANAELRLIGKTKAEIDHDVYVNDIITQQNALQSAYDACLATMADTTYPWDNDSIQRAIDTWYGCLAESYAWITPEGEVGPEWWIDQSISEEDFRNEKYNYLVAAVRGLQNARNYVINQNKPYNDLVAKVAEAEAVCNEPTYVQSGADMSVVKDLIAQAKEMIANVTPTNDGDNFNNTISEINAALDAMKMSVAGYGREADLAVINPFFSENGARGNGNTVKPTGWLDSSYDYENGSDKTNGNPRFKKDDNWEGGYFFEVWRGYTAYPKNKACQTISVENKGLYIYQADAYAGNEGKNSRAEDDKMIVMVDRLDENGNIVTVQHLDSLENGVDEEGNVTYEYFYTDVAVQDTTYVTGVCLVLGDEFADALDSLHVHSDYPDLYTPKTYRMEYVNTQGAMSLKFGLDAIGNLGCNLYGFGANHVYYCGDADKYHQDQALGIEAKPVDLLQQASKGVYNLQGIKVADKLDANLPKGVYIFGKQKYIVK